MITTQERQPEQRTDGPVFLSSEEAVTLGAALQLLPRGRHAPSWLWLNLAHGPTVQAASMDESDFGLSIKAWVADPDQDEVRVELRVCDQGVVEECAIHMPSGLVEPLAGPKQDCMPDNPYEFAIEAIGTYALWASSYVEPSQAHQPAQA